MNIDSKCNPFGNFNEPWPHPEYKPHLKGWRRKLSWWVRNPLHNFCFFWIGYYGEPLHFYGDFLKPGYHKAVLRVGIRANDTIIYKPIYSYKGKYVEGYIGWRRTGAFGIALRRANSPDSSEVTK